MGAHRNSPKQKPTTLKFLLDLDFRFSSAAGQPHAKSHHAHILPLITSCSKTYTFTDPSESPSHQNLKRDCLLKLLSFVNPSKTPLPPDILSSLFNMISVNLFRSFPPPTAASRPAPSNAVLFDDDDAAPAAAWPHLSIVYDILLRLVVGLEAKDLTRYINNSFIIRLLALFQSEDERERESLKNVWHKIYSKFHASRSSIRKAMNDAFLDYIFEGSDQKHRGIGDLLEILGTIINGFSVPLKEEHKLCLTKVLIPLHRPKGMPSYHKQLAYCIYQFVEKEPLLGVTVVRSILRYWPKTSCQKEVLLIGEMEDLVEKMEAEQYRIVAVPLCRQITKCLNSANVQVAERAHYVWNKERFVKMAASSAAAEEVFPVIVQGMEKNLREHWSRSVRELTENVKEMLEGMEPVLYAKCLSELDVSHASAERRRIRESKWAGVEMAAKINQFIQHLQCPRPRINEN